MGFPCRHVWTGSQRGLPQGDPLALWALNLVMSSWVWSLPGLDLVRVFLDDRCLLRREVSALSTALRITANFDAAFGMQIHPRKSCRFFVGDPQVDAEGWWGALPLKVVIKYLGVQLETDLGASHSQGDSRVSAVRTKILRARLPPKPLCRRCWGHQTGHRSTDHCCGASMVEPHPPPQKPHAQHSSHPGIVIAAA